MKTFLFVVSFATALAFAGPVSANPTDVNVGAQGEVAGKQYYGARGRGSRF